MKIRKYFVSNSSTSSFICDITGELVSERDISLVDAEMYECENGHTFNEKYIQKTTWAKKKAYVLQAPDLTWSQETKEIVKNLNDDEFEEWWEDDEDGELRYNLPAILCPLCQFKYGKKDEILSFLLFKEKIIFSHALSLIKNEYGDWQNLKEKVLNKTNLNQVKEE